MTEPRSTIAHTVPAAPYAPGWTGARPTVNLPAPPWGTLDHDDRSATAPRTPPIRAAAQRPAPDPRTSRMSPTARAVFEAGESVGWDCTQADIAAEVGTSRESVNKICRHYGWQTRGHCEGDPSRRDVYLAITSAQPRARGRA